MEELNLNKVDILLGYLVYFSIQLCCYSVILRYLHHTGDYIPEHGSVF